MKVSAAAAAKPPYPFQRGLYGHPTIINNVETLANIPAIMEKGATGTGIGTQDAPNKSICAGGDIVNTGIVEVPIGMPLEIFHSELAVA